MSKPIQMEKGVKYRDADKMALIPVKNMPTEQKEVLRKPDWMKIKLPADSQRIQDIKAAMRKNTRRSRNRRQPRPSWPRRISIRYWMSRGGTLGPLRCDTDSFQSASRDNRRCHSQSKS